MSENGKLLNSKGAREFVLQNCPYYSFRSRVWVGNRESHDALPLPYRSMELGGNTVEPELLGGLFLEARD